MARLLAAFETMKFTHKPARLAGGTPPMVSIVRIQGGVQREMQFTPDICHGVLAVVGILPGMTPQSVMADIQRVIDTCAAADPELKATARPYPGALFVDGTLEQDEEQTHGRARPLLSAHPQGGAGPLSQERLQRHHPLRRAWPCRHHVRSR